MNLILFEEQDFVAQQRAVVQGRRLNSLLETHRAEVGQEFRAGLLNGLQGQAKLLSIDKQQAEFTVALDTPPPAKLPVTLILALPRPKMLRRILQTIAAMGVSKLVLVNSFRVEKSYWQTPILYPDAVREQLMLGLEQAMDTVLPEVVIEKRFKPFVEDRLPELSRNTLKLVAHPGDYTVCPRALSEPVTLAIGPEGGWIEYEVNKLEQAGFTAVQLGARILRVETAVTALLARLY